MLSNYNMYQNNTAKFNELRKSALNKAQIIANETGDDMLVGLDEYEFDWNIKPASCPSAHELFELSEVTPSFEKKAIHQLKM